MMESMVRSAMPIPSYPARVQRLLRPVPLLVAGPLLLQPLLLALFGGRFTRSIHGNYPYFRAWFTGATPTLTEHFFAYNYPYYGWGPWHRTHPHWRNQPISEPRDYRGRRLANDLGGSWLPPATGIIVLDRLQQQRLRRDGDGLIIRDQRPASQPA